MSQPQPQHYPPDVDAVLGGKALYDDIIHRLTTNLHLPLVQAHEIAQAAWPYLKRTNPAQPTP